MTTYLLVDSMNMLKRGHAVAQGTSFERAGLALMITINSIKWAFQKFNADHVLVAAEGRSWRKDIYPSYKANRAVTAMNRDASEVEDDNLFFETSDDFLKFIKNDTRCTLLQHSRCEADDFIARFIQLFGQDPSNHFVIVSADTDFVQLLAPNVDIYDGVQKKLYRTDGVFDEKMKPWTNKKGDTVPTINPEYVLFEKCIRGDKSDNVMSAYPGVRSKGNVKKPGIEEAFADRINQGFVWQNFMKSKWADINGVDHIVEDDYKMNKRLIDLTMQPDDIKEILDKTILEAIEHSKDINQIGMRFLKFCSKHELKKLAEHPDNIVNIFNKGFKLEEQQVS